MSAYGDLIAQVSSTLDDARGGYGNFVSSGSEAAADMYSWFDKLHHSIVFNILEVN